MNTIPCITDSDEWRFEPEPKVSNPVWIKKPDEPEYMAAVEKSAHVDTWGLCQIWRQWRNHPHHHLDVMLHGWLMMSGLNDNHAAYNEVHFLYSLLDGE